MDLTSKIPHNIADKGTNVDANNYFRNILRRVLTACGLNVVDHPQFTVRPQLVLMYVASHILALSFIIMLFTEVPINEKLEALCLMGGVFQGIGKLYAVVLYPHQFYNLMEVLRKMHITYMDDPIIGPVLKKICVYCTISFECFAIAFYGVAISYVLLPIFLWTRYSIMTTIFPIHLPFINWQETTGFIINIVHHLYSVSIGITALMSGDVAFLYFVLHSIGYLQIFKCRIDKLNEMLEDQPQNLPIIRAQLVSCIQAHQDYISYIEMVDATYSSLCMSQLFTSELYLILSLLLTLWRKWIVGPFMSICGLCQVLQYCILGTVVTIQNDKVSDIIYGMYWYLLPVNEQRLVILIILRGQKPAELNVGRFAKLNVATCMQLLKTTYTYVMMMLEFLA